MKKPTLAFFALLLGSGLALAQTDPGLAPSVPAESLFTLLRKGGPVMIPLALCSVIALSLGIERLISLRRRAIIPEDFLSRLTTHLKNPNEGTADAIRYCEETGSPAGRIFRAGLNRLGSDEEVEKALEDTGGREASKLKRSLRWLSIIATISPLLGLLGTVYGMIIAFQTATAVGMGKAEVLAQGIYEALVTTATGLTIAIPVLILHQYLSGRIDARLDQIDTMADEFLEVVRRLNPSKKSLP